MAAKNTCYYAVEFLETTKTAIFRNSSFSTGNHRLEHTTLLEDSSQTQSAQRQLRDFYDHLLSCPL